MTSRYPHETLEEAFLGHSTAPSVQRRPTLTELETLRDARGYQLEVFTTDGLQFKCRYRPEDIPSMYEAIRNLMREHATRYFQIQINPLLESEWPSKPMTMEQWAAAGHTLD